MIPGSCCCGAIQFKLLAQPKMMVTCHCSRCRKVGASTFVLVSKESFHWIEGQEFVATFKAAPPYTYDRTFCRVCGTALGEIGSDMKTFPIAANCLDADPIVRTKFHEFVGEKPAWYDICDDAKQFDQYPEKTEGERL